MFERNILHRRSAIVAACLFAFSSLAHTADDEVIEKSWSPARTLRVHRKMLSFPLT